MTPAVWHAALAAALAALPTAPAPSPAGGYTLRGPYPVAVKATRSESRTVMADGTMSLTLFGGELDFPFGFVKEDETEVETLASKNGRPTRVRHKIIRHEEEETAEVLEKKKVVKTVSPLAGEVVVSERTADGWVHRLEGDRKPTAEQAKALLTFTNPDGDTNSLPEGKVRLGDTWELNSTHLRRYFGEEVRGLSGKMACTLLRVESVGGEDCAVIEVAGTMTSQMVAVGDTPEGTMTFGGTVTQHMSLATGVVVKQEAVMTVEKVAKQKVDDLETTVRVKGTVRSTSKGRAVP